MVSNIYGIFFSILWVALVLIASTFIKNKLRTTDEINRKFVHILVANVWFISMFFFTNSLWASFVPTLFVLINTFSYRFSLISSIERKHKQLKDLGTVYYPISLAILSITSFSSWSAPYVGALGVFVMGYGDGFAALVGQRWGKRVFSCFSNQKTILGTIVMFSASFLLLTILLYTYEVEYFLIIGFLLAIWGTVLETITPFGMDNLTVPLGVALGYQFLFF